MTYPSSLRLLGLRPLAPEPVLDGDIRRSVAGPLGSLPGVRAVIAGRRDPDEGGERVLVSVLQSVDTLTDRLTTGSDGRSPEPGELTHIPNAEVDRLQTLPLVVALEFDTLATPTIMRIFAGRTRPGGLRAYVEQAHAGTYAEVMAAHRPVALYLAVDEPDRFLTVSLWTAWDRIEAATGGNVRSPVATRHGALLAGGSAVHYEILATSAGQPEAARAS